VEQRQELPVVELQQELDELRTSVRKFLNARIPESRVRELTESGDSFDPDLWAEMGSMLGVHGLAIPERFGGDGFGLLAGAVVFEELGRALTPVPYYSTFVGAQTLLAAGDDDACARYLPGVADGTIRLSVAAAEQDGSWDAAVIKTRAAQNADGTWQLTGTKYFVPDAAAAHMLIVFARTTAGPTLFALDPAADGVQITAMDVLDATRPLAVVTLEAAPAQLIGRQGGAGSILARSLDFAALALAAEGVGAAQRCLELSVEYATMRQQFGRPVGSFQAVKHLCAEMLAQVELARAATEDAFHLTDMGSPGSAIATAAAHITTSAAVMFVAKETIQVHGGIGFTWEHPAHLYFRRAKASQMLLGGPSLSHERLLDRMGI
jgi:alkylation response protein AidB-like acyl-CoA dehydrogenase